ncbi:unnamed protein product [Umbelopsis vinacea]
MQSEAQENFLNFGHDNSFQNTEFQLEDSDVYSISSISSDSHMADYSSSEDEQAGKHGQTSLSTQNQGSAQSNMERKKKLPCNTMTLQHNEFSLFHQQRETELLKVLKIRRKLARKQQRLTLETSRKRALLDEQKAQLKQLEADTVSLAVALKVLKTQPTPARKKPEAKKSLPPPPPTTLTLQEQQEQQQQLLQHLQMQIQQQQQQHHQHQ